MSYYRATRHPWPCLWFLLPLLIGYEAGMWWLGQESTPPPRNGADAWMRWGVEELGIREMFVVPALVIGLMVVWCMWRRSDRPRGTFATCMGMTIESIVFAMGLWALSRNFGLILDRFGVPVNVPMAVDWTGVVTYIGAGIYEEVLFRLLLFGGLTTLLRLVFVPTFMAVPFAALVSAFTFAGAHHAGPHGEEWDLYVFIFRVTAGVYFALLFWLRGFGITVGAHAGYDVLVGVEWG